MDFEAMYAIKVRGTPEEILDQLSRFGREDARFLRLRFVDVRWLEGVPNEVGSIVRYHVPVVGLQAELRLTKRVGNDTMMYELNDDLCTDGKLVFNLAPAQAGTRLVIYAAFNYKKGEGPTSRAMWRCARTFFPEFIHDVVWNHALCTIKEEVELRHDHP
jgi:hypothetical protein